MSALPRRSPSQIQAQADQLRSLPEPMELQVGGRRVQVEFFLPPDAKQREEAIQAVIARAMARKREQP